MDEYRIALFADPQCAAVATFLKVLSKTVRVCIEFHVGLVLADGTFHG
jgi:hypothetical protein